MNVNRHATSLTKLIRRDDLPEVDSMVDLLRLNHDCSVASYRGEIFIKNGAKWTSTKRHVSELGNARVHLRLANGDSVEIC